MYPSQNIRTLRILKTLSIFHNDAGNSITDAILLSGQSDRMVLQAYTQKSDQLFETNESALTNMDGFQLTPVFGVLMTVGCSMAIVFLSISGKKWYLLKLIYYEKATKFYEIFPLLLSVRTVDKRWRFRKILWPSQNIRTLQK